MIVRLEADERMLTASERETFADSIQSVGPQYFPVAKRAEDGTWWLIHKPVQPSALTVTVKD